MFKKWVNSSPAPLFTQPFFPLPNSPFPFPSTTPFALFASFAVFQLFNHKERKVHKAVVKALRLYNHFTLHHGVWGETPAIKPHEHPERIQQSNRPMASTTPFALFVSFAVFQFFNHKERKVHKAVVKALRLYNHFPIPFALFASFAAKIPLPPKILNRPRQPLLQRDLRLPA